MANRNSGMLPDIKDKTVLVTGASGDIGSEISKLFAGYGAKIGIHYRQNERAAGELLNAVKAVGGGGVLLRADLLDETDRDKLVDDFISVFGGIDVLINNAGGPIGNIDYKTLDPVSWRKTFILNVEAPFFLSRKVFPLMKASGGGRIINISSVAAKYGGSDLTIHYGSAKAALENVTVAMAKRGAPDGIRVNAIRAGVIDTAFHKKHPKENFDKRIAMIPIGRIGEVADVAQAALFLASSSSSYITGQVISVSGGE